MYKVLTPGTKTYRIAGNLVGANFRMNDRDAFRIKFHIFNFACAASPNCFETRRIAAWLPCSEAHRSLPAARAHSFSSWLRDTCSTSHCLVSILTGCRAELRDADRGPLVSGRASTVWKYRYNANVRSRSQLAGLYFTRVRILPRLVCSVPIQNLMY